MTTDSVYLDNHATTPVDPAVLEQMLPAFGPTFGNAASRSHSFGWAAEAAVDRARAQIAKPIGARPKEIVLTSGATESINLALKGLAEFYPDRGNHFISCRTEHKATIDTVAALEAKGHPVTWLTVDADGLIDLDELRAAIDEQTLCVSIMAANNEVGVLQPLAEIGAICREREVFFHCDAAQAYGKIPLNADELGIDLMSISGHKIYGPKGVGALYVRRRKPRVQLAEQIHGGGHEGQMRSGTLNVPGIIGLGAAAELCATYMASEEVRIRGLRDRLFDGLQAGLKGVQINGSREQRLAGNLNVSFAGIEGESLLLALGDALAVSSGSACTSASVEPSYVLREMGIKEELALASIRFGVGRFNDEKDIDRAIAVVVETVCRLRGEREERPEAERVRSRGDEQ